MWVAKVQGFEGQIKKTIRMYKPYILILLETKVDSSWARTIIRKLTSNYSKDMSPIGLTGGIWMVWNYDRCHINICKKHSRFIHFVCQDIVHNYKWYSNLYMDILTRILEDICKPILSPLILLMMNFG